MPDDDYKNVVFVGGLIAGVDKDNPRAEVFCLTEGVVFDTIKTYF